MDTKRVTKNNYVEKFNYHYLLGLKPLTDKGVVDIEFFKAYDSNEILTICGECLLLNCTDENKEGTSTNSESDPKKESDELNNFRYENMTLKIESVMNDLIPCLIHSDDKLSKEAMHLKITENVSKIGQEEFIKQARIEI